MILICYDIESNSLRSKLSKKITAAGLDRINLSVFLGDLKDTDQRRLIAALRQLMMAAGARDSLIILPVTQHQVWNMEVLGRNDYDIPTITGERHTMIF